MPSRSRLPHVLVLVVAAVTGLRVLHQRAILATRCNALELRFSAESDSFERRLELAANYLQRMPVMAGIEP